MNIFEIKLRSNKIVVFLRDTWLTWHWINTKYVSITFFHLLLFSLKYDIVYLKVFNFKEQVALSNIANVERRIYFNSVWKQNIWQSICFLYILYKYN